MNTEQLIESLGRNLQPAPSRWPVSRVALSWLGVSTLYAATLFLALGPLRYGVGSQLTENPRFLVEMMTGTLALIALMTAAFRQSVPGTTAGWIEGVGWAALLLWLAHFALGTAFPVLEPSMLGKRPHCLVEAYLYSIPPLVWLLWLQRRRYPLRPARAAFNGATAAALLPALLMQIGCMYEPHHILQNHVLPMLPLLIIAPGIVFVQAARSGR